jgi:hypothetical protein
VCVFICNRFYLRFSELIAPTLQELIAQIAVNERAAFMAGIPQRLELDEIGVTAQRPPHVSSSPSPRRPPLAPPPTDDVYSDLPGEEEDAVYEDVDEQECEQHLANDDSSAHYGDDAYGDPDGGSAPAPPPPRPPKSGPVSEELLYGDTF